MTAEASPEPAPKAPALPARRGKLVPILLVTLNVGVLAVLAIFLLPKLGLRVSFGDSPVEADISALDPKLLVTRDGGRLNPVVFGNLIFEVTRVGYYPDVRSRTVTITVPGAPPESALFRVGDTFAGGRIRVVEILPDGVILECAGKQQSFGLLGAETVENAAAPSPTGMTVLPARSAHVIPDLQPGQTKPAADPRQSQPVEEPGAHKIESIDELPEYCAILEREEFKSLLANLAQIVKSEIVFAPVLERETKMPLGLEIKNIKPQCPLALHGLRAGDIILYFNGEDIRRLDDLDVAVKSLQLAEQISIEFRREGEQLLLIIQPGVPEDSTPEPGKPRQG